jgi:hypothetical protein
MRQILNFDLLRYQNELLVVTHVTKVSISRTTRVAHKQENKLKSNSLRQRVSETACVVLKFEKNTEDF